MSPFGPPDCDGVEPARAMRAAHSRASQHLEPGTGQIGCIGARVDQRDGRAGPRQIGGHRAGAVVVGENDGTTPGEHAEAMQIVPRRRCEHDAGPVIARKHQRPFDRAGRQHNAARPHLP